MLSNQCQFGKFLWKRIKVMIATRPQPLWIKTMALLSLILLGWLMHHVVEGHHGEHLDDRDVDCPLCLLAASLFIIAAVVSAGESLVCLGSVCMMAFAFHSTTSTAFGGRAPPAPVVL